MLHQNEQHEQMEIMTNNGKGKENDKGNIFEPELWKKKQRMYNGVFLKSLSIDLLTNRMSITPATDNHFCDHHFSPFS